jgi:membrane-bound inhibitor of C-type lysozyme
MTRLGWPGVFLAGAFAAALPVQAEDISIKVPAGTKVETVEARYECGDQPVSAQYINAGSVSLAVLTMGDEFVVASNVIAGSGARYAGGQYVWWTKGADATLYDVRKGEADPGIPCKPSQ